MNPQLSRQSRPILILSLLAVFLFAILPLPASISYALGPGCATAGTTGLTAKVVATSGQVVTGTIDATGCDVGVYVGPGVTGVSIRGATITGANDHGIFVQDTSRITIMGNTVTNNGLAPHNTIAENKAVELDGTSNSIVKGNVVSFNLADGGIAVADDGAIDPGAPNPGSNLPGTGNMVMNNLVEYNLFGCGIVVASYNTAGVSDNMVKGNTVLGATYSTIPTYGPAVGGIVVAADTPFSKAVDNVVQDNFIKGSLIPGVVVHSNAPGDVVSGTVVIHNTIDSNGLMTETTNEPYAPNGIMVVAEAFQGEPNAPVITNTVIISNTITNDYFGVWVFDASHTVIHNVMGNSVVPVFNN